MANYFKLLTITIFSRFISSNKYEISNYIDGIHGFVFNGFTTARNNGQWNYAGLSYAGDINGDGYSDIIIGDPGVSKSYVVFGGRSFNRSLEPSNLTGTNGFVLNGEPGGGWMGYSVSSAVDINGDGYSDIIIGAFGNSYVVFGGRSFNRSLEPSNLTGTNGFVLNVGAAANFGGKFVSSAGDINSDGYSDIIIGDSYASPNGNVGAGKSYVVFGGREFNRSLDLSSLNGTNGFVLNGEAKGDNSGYSVSSAGDINGDGYSDIIIGAGSLYSSRGKSYVVFGGKTFNRTLELSNLTGTNGFAINDELEGESIGRSVSSAGDINGDGYSDILIASYSTSFGALGGAKSYVVLGGRSFNRSLELSNLTGTNGFVLNGNSKNFNEGAGDSVSSAGDINGDGYSDIIIGAPDIHGISGGKSYVVFGGAVKFISNSLTIASGAKVLLTQEQLNISVPGNKSFTILINNDKFGRFERVNNEGVSINSFTSDELGSGQIQFVQEGSKFAPTYTVCVYPGYYFESCQRANITFYGVMPSIDSKQITISQGTPLQLSLKHIRALDPDNAPLSLRFIASNVSNAKFEYRQKDRVYNISAFTQSDLSAGNIWLVPDGSDNAPEFMISVGDRYTFTKPIPVNVKFNYAPKIAAIEFVAQQNQWTVLSDKMFTVYDNDTSPSSLVVSVMDEQEGNFEYSSGFKISKFSMNDILYGNIGFRHKGDKPPSFTAVVSDGKALSKVFRTNAVLNRSPVAVSELASHRLAKNKYFEIMIDANAFMDPDGDDLSFSASLSNGMPLTGGLSFSNITLSGFFYASKPISIRITASDGVLNVSQNFGISLLGSYLDANTLTLKQNEIVDITEENLAFSANSGLQLTYVVSNISHGYFSNNGQKVSRFSAVDLDNDLVKFVHDGSFNAPSYMVGLQDYAGFEIGEPSRAKVIFNSRPILNISSNLILDQGQATTLTRTTINAVDSGAADSELLIKLSDLDSGYCRYKGTDYEIKEFYYLSIIQNKIEFVHDGSKTSPRFSIVAVDKGGLMSQRHEVQAKLNHIPQVLTALPDIDVVRGQEFSITIPIQTFSDFDADKLMMSATLDGGVPLPDNIVLSDGVLKGESEKDIVVEISASDRRGLSAKQSFAINVEDSKFQQAQTLGSFSGAAFAIACFIWLRYNDYKHRSRNKLASLLRKKLDLSYTNFGRFKGDVYRSKIEQLHKYLNKGWFIYNLSNAEFNCFVGLIAETILNINGLVKKAGFSSRVVNLILFQHFRESLKELDFKILDANIYKIGFEVMQIWNTEGGHDKWHFTPRVEFEERLFYCAKVKPTEHKKSNTLRQEVYALESEIKELRKLLKKPGPGAIT